MRCLLQGRILILNSDEEENKLDKADTQAEIIHSQGRTIQQRKGRSVYEYDAFMLLKQTIHDYFVRFHKLVNDIKITQLNIPTHQMNTKSISSQKPTEPHGQKDAQETGAVYKIANLLMVSKKAVSHPPTTALTSSISGLMLRCRNGHIVTEPVQRKAPEEKTVARQCKRTQEKEWNLMYFKDKALLMKLKRKEIRDEGAHACSMLSSPTCQPLGATNKAVNEVHTYDNQIFDNVIIQIQRCTQAESFRPDAETEILMTIRFRIIIDLQVKFSGQSLKRLMAVFSSFEGQAGNQLAIEGNRGSRNNGNQVRGRAYNVNVNAEEASRDPNVVTGTFSLNDCFATILFDSGADFSFISTEFVSMLNVKPRIVNPGYEIEIADGKRVEVNRVVCDCKLELGNSLFDIELIPIGYGSFDVEFV
ncbi:putative reverse transcriptase domain-containing protein [Tanacetum coccineum]